LTAAILRILLDQGHGLGNVRVDQYDPGAVSCGEEAALVRRVADEVLQECALSTPSIVILPECGVQCINRHPRSPRGAPKSHLRYKVQWLNEHYKPFDFLISLHANSASEGGASGVEVYYSDDAPDIRRRQAEAASAALAAVLELPNRGAKPSWKSQHPRLPILDSTKVPALLFELGFITNPVDTEAIEKRGSAAVIAAIEAIRRVK
jgi:hypothetical protein